MLNFAKNLLSVGNSNNANQTSTTLECDLFVLDGGNWQAMTDGKCDVTFSENEKNGPVMVFKCAAESFTETIKLDNLLNLSRFEDPETGYPCFQWIVRKSKSGDNMEEFGARFSSQKAADKFVSQITALGQQTADIVFESECTVSLVEKVSNSGWDVIQDQVSVIVSKSKNGDHYLTVSEKDGSEILFHSLLSPALQIQSDSSLYSFLGFTPLSDDIRILGLEFEENDDTSFKSVLSSSGALPTPRPPREAAPSVAPAIEDIVMWSDEEEYVSAPIQSRRKRHRESDIMNRLLETSHASSTNRAIVFSDDKRSGKFGFQVFDTTKSKPDPYGSFTPILPPSRKTTTGVSAKSVMIHDADSKVLMLDPQYGRDKILELDLERGSVVNEWSPGEGVSVNTILPVNKLAQSSGEKTFLGMNEKSLFLIDPRISDKTKSQRAMAFNYSTNVKLACAATDADGHIVAANRTGQLRLFDGESNRDGELKRAKSLLAGCGDSITHVDVTGNGEWILGTCATYLVLVNVLGSDGRTGFQKSVSSEVEPITLALDYADIAKYKLSSIQFTPARFDESKKLIVSSTGSLAIVWDLGLLEKTGDIVYSIKPMKEFILDTNVVATGRSGDGRRKQISESVVAMYSDKIEIARVVKKRTSISRD